MQINHRDHILLTGGTGFFGKAILRQWMNHRGSKPQISILSRNPQAFIDANPELSSHVNWLKGDILTPSSLPWQSKFTHILHAAADSTLGPRLTPLEKFHQIVTGTLNVLQFAVSTRAFRFLLASSGAVYGEQPELISNIREDFLGMPNPLDPMQSYGIAKRTAEYLCALYRDQFGIETIYARCFAFGGPDLPLDAHFAIGNLVRDALVGHELVINSDGKAIRSYMHQDDLAHWLMTLLFEGGDGEAYNVGCEVPISIFDLACKIKAALSPEIKISLKTDTPVQKGRSRYVPSTEKARTELDLVCHKSLAEIIADMAHAHRSSISRP